MLVHLGADLVLELVANRRALVLGLAPEIRPRNDKLDFNVRVLVVWQDVVAKPAVGLAWLFATDTGIPPGYSQIPTLLPRRRREDTHQRERARLVTPDLVRERPGVETEVGLIEPPVPRLGLAEEVRVGHWLAGPRYLVRLALRDAPSPPVSSILLLCPDTLILWCTHDCQHDKHGTNERRHGAQDLPPPNTQHSVQLRGQL